MFREQNFLPDSIISIRRKIVFLSLKEKSASKASRCVVIIRKIFFPTRWIIPNISRFQNILCMIVTLISESIKKRFTKCSDFSAVERKFPRNIENFLGSGEIFANTLARRVLVDACWSTVVRRVTSLKDIIKVGYDAYTYRLIHSACFSVLLAVCASCLPRVPMAARLSTGLKVSFEHARGFVLGERLLSVRMFARCISCSTVLPLRIRRVTVIRGSGILGTETPVPSYITFYA